MKPKISVLVSARKNSKYLAKFMFGFYERTADPLNVQLLVMMNEHDTWNSELVSFMEFSAPGNIKFFRENHQLGRAGLHKYLNDLVPYATGDWIIYFCEDHFIIADKWDLKIRNFIKDKDLNPDMVYCIIPKFDNVGAMNQILSKGYVKALGGVLGRHGWIDSYINELNGLAFGDLSDRVLRMNDELFHDFTHDNPNPMSDAHLQGVITDGAKKLPKFEDPEVRELISRDAGAIKTKMEFGL